MLNYVSQPTVEVIQIFARYVSIPSPSYQAQLIHCLGMTERMCLVLGLHVESTGFSPEEQTIRRRVW